METATPADAAALRTPVPGWLLAAALTGVAFHAAVQLVEIDMFLLPVLGAFAALGAAFLYLDVQAFAASPAGAVAHLCAATGGFAAGLAVSMLVYRAFFHRLRRFPGPWQARLSKLYAVWLSKDKVQYHLELLKMHQQYGDVVRTGPRELSIIRPSALPYIAACRKSTLYQLSDWNDDRLGLIETRNIDDHRRRRRPWETALNTKSIYKYDPEMQRVIGTLLAEWSSPARQGKPVNVTEWMAWLSYDLMGIVGFGRDFGQLAGGGVEHWAVRALRSQQMFFGVLKPIPWLCNAAAKIPGADRAVAPFVEYCKGLVREKRETWRTASDNSSTPTDILSWLLQAYESGSPNAPRTPQALDEDGRTIVVAGADTTSNTLVNALFYLSRHPSVYASLQRTLDAIFPAASGDAAFAYDKVKDVPLLDAVVHETLRLKPPVPSGNPRVTPPEGVRVPGVAAEGGEDLWIPGGVDVYMPQWVLHRDERWFERADEWRPERWLEEGERMVKEKGAFFPFQIGMYACVGKQLAMWELRSILARIALQFDIAVPPDCDDDGKIFDEGVQDTFTMTLPPLHLIFTERKKQ